MKLRNLLTVALLSACCLPACAQRHVRLDLPRTVQLATDSSMTRNLYQSVYDTSKWDYLKYMAGRKPQITLESTPLEYDHYIVKRYLSTEDRDVYRQQRLLSSEASVKVTQIFEPLGGTFYGSTGLGFLKTFGEYNYSQFTTVPILVGYKQELFGFNSLKWERLIEEAKINAATKALSRNMEVVAAEAAEKFFDLALAQSQYDMAQNNLKQCDTLYTIGARKFDIASISKAELLILEIDKQNADNSLVNSRLQVTRAMKALVTFLRMEEGTQLDLVMPVLTPDIVIDVNEALRYARENNPTYLSDQQSILEAERDLDKAKVERRMNLGFDLRIGLNQVDKDLWYAYGHPLLQDYVTVSLSVPLKDWGVGKYNVAAATSRLYYTQESANLNDLNLETEVRNAVNAFNVQHQIVQNTLHTREIAENAYDSTFLRFASGKATVTDITMAQSRWQTATQNYINALKDYWICYFNVRKVTLHDFLAGR